MTEPNTPTDPKTLSQRLAEGRIPAIEGLRYAMILAETLRRMHDEGRAHGAVAPGNISLAATGLELQPSRLTPEAAAYAAPEVLDGRAADTRSDVFSFGAVLYEILTGRAPYPGKDRSAPTPSGSPAVDRLVASCVAVDPAARCQRMQKVMLELKLLLVAATRAAAGPVAHRDSASEMRAELVQMEARLNARLQAQEKKSAELLKAAGEALNRPQDESGEDVRAAMLQMESRIAGRMQAFDKKVGEIQKAAAEALYRESASPAVTPAEVEGIEARLSARLQASEHAMAEMQRVTSETVAALREQLGLLGSQITAAREQAARAEQSVEASGARLLARVQQGMDALGERIGQIEQRFGSMESQAPGADAARVEAVEAGLAELRKQSDEMRELVAEDMLSFEHTLKTQASAIESTRTAMAQTDDLVERVVEALESLQSTVLDHSEDRAMAIN